MLLQSRPRAAWTGKLLCADLAQRDEKESADLLAAFHWHGFLAAEPDGTYRYQPRSAELRRQAGSLATVYANQRLTVLTELANLASLAPIRNFAEAFRIRKDRSDG